MSVCMSVCALHVCLGTVCSVVMCCTALPQDTLVKQNLIRSMDLIGRSLHTDHLKKTFVFSKRVDLINHLLVSRCDEGGSVSVHVEQVCGRVGMRMREISTRVQV